MFKEKWKLGLIFYSVFLFFLFAKSVQAYVDPGTGSYLLQLLAAGLLSGLFFMKNAIRSAKRFFGKMFVVKNEIIKK